MATPFKSKTGTYLFRRRVPKDLHPILGDKTISVSLRTKDIAKAKRQFIAVSAKFEREWDRLRAKMAQNALEPPLLPEESDPLTRWQMYGLAGQFARFLPPSAGTSPVARLTGRTKSTATSDGRDRPAQGRRGLSRCTSNP